MTKLEELMKNLCPNGVEWIPLWQVTIWDKKFTGIERYKQPQVITYPYLLANELFAMEQESGDVFLLSTGEKTGWTTEALAGEYLCEGEVVTIPWGKSRAVTDCIKYYKGKFVTADNRIMTSNDTSRLNNKFLYYWIMRQGTVIDKFYRGSGIKHPSMKDVLELKIPLPPLAVQYEIVRILDEYTAKTEELIKQLEAELEARKKQYEYYRDKLLSFTQNNENGGGCNVQWLTVDELFTLKNGYTPSKSNPDFWECGTIPWFRMEDIRTQGRILTCAIQNVTDAAVKAGNLTKAGSLILSTTATIGEHALVLVDCLTNQQITSFTLKDCYRSFIEIKYLFYQFYKFGEWCQDNVHKGGSVPIIGAKKLREYKIPVPPLAEQERIVAILDRFDKLCNDISEGLPAEIEARRKQYEYYRDKLLTFEELSA